MQFLRWNHGHTNKTQVQFQVDTPMFGRWSSSAHLIKPEAGITRVVYMVQIKQNEWRKDSFISLAVVLKLYK